MLLEQVSETQLQAGRIMAGAAMVALIAAPMFRRQAQTIRLLATVLYITFLLGLLIYFLY